MGIPAAAGEEFIEEIMFGATYAYVMPKVRDYISKEFPDEKDEKGHTKPNIMKDAVESAINVIVMGVLFMIVRYEEAFLEKLFAFSRTAILGIYGGARTALNFIKERIKGKRGVAARSMFSKFGDDVQSKALIAQNIHLEASNIIEARQTQYISTQSYMPSAQAMDTVVARQQYQEFVGSAKAQTRLQLAMFKLLSATFNESDKQTLRTIYKTIDPSGGFDPEKADIDKLNKISEFMFVKDESGHITGLSAAFMELINGLSYVHNKSTSTTTGA